VNCDIASATVVVLNPIDAVVDDFSETQLPWRTHTSDYKRQIKRVSQQLLNSSIKLLSQADPNGTNPAGLT
jgi:hypothetical protein